MSPGHFVVNNFFVLFSYQIDNLIISSDIINKNTKTLVTIAYFFVFLSVLLKITIIVCKPKKTTSDHKTGSMIKPNKASIAT